MHTRAHTRTLKRNVYLKHTNNLDHSVHTSVTRDLQDRKTPADFNTLTNDLVIAVMSDNVIR